MKICKECQEEKPLSQYYQDKRGYYFGKCKKCFIVQVRRRVDPDKKKLNSLKYRQSPKGKDSAAAWWKTKGKAFDKQRNSTPERREFYNKRQKKRISQDPEYYKTKRRARDRHTTADIIRLVLQRDKKCRLCGSISDLQIDHIFPESLGGKGTLENLQVLCGSCNNFKSDNLFLPNGGVLIVSADLKRRLVGERCRFAPRVVERD